MSAAGCKCCGREAPLGPTGYCDAWCEHFGTVQQEAEQATFEGDARELVRVTYRLLRAWKRRRHTPTEEEWRELENAADAVSAWLDGDFEQGERSA